MFDGKVFTREISAPRTVQGSSATPDRFVFESRSSMLPGLLRSSGSALGTITFWEDNK